MPTYLYTATDRAGRVVRGSMDADCEDAVRAKLAAASYQQTAVTAERAPVAAPLPGPPASRPAVTVPTMALAQFHRKMAGMTRAGVPIIQALRTVRETSRHPELCRAIEEMEETAERGRPISQAMERRPAVFRRGHAGLIEYGEGTGRLADAFEGLATELDSDWLLERATRMNPALFCVRWFIGPAVAIPALMALPMLWPALGQGGIGVGVAAVFVLSVFGLLAFTAYPAIAAAARRMPSWPRIEDALNQIPGVGARRSRLDRVRIVNALAAGLDAGAPLSTVWTLAANSPDSDLCRRRMEAQTRRIMRGEPISNCLLATALFSETIVDAARIAEMAGNLPQALRHATRYDREEAALIGSLTPWVLGTIAYIMYLVVGSILALMLSPK
ncbi:MAG TPA: type II secretion system F family protein [Armatimonadota bacterium]|jgi:type II secretory pathway component PulF